MTHEHGHEHGHEHVHEHGLARQDPEVGSTTSEPCANNAPKVIVLRTPSGLSGDMLVTGLSRLAEVSDAVLDQMLIAIGPPELVGSLSVRRHFVNGISGWKADVDLPLEHHHRTLQIILEIIEMGQLSAGAKQLASRTFNALALAEARVHGVEPEKISFHEVGALDSILDICMSAALLDQISPDAFFCSPLPLCDGVISCEHGLLASPAPAVQELLQEVPVYGIESKGETVTPTALAFLKAARVTFGKWPEVRIQKVARVYGGRVLEGVPNGAIFALGIPSPRSEE